MSIAEVNGIKNNVEIDSIIKFEKKQIEDKTKKDKDELNDLMNELYIDTVKYFYDLFHSHVTNIKVVYTTVNHLCLAASKLYQMLSKNELPDKYENRYKNITIWGSKLKTKYDDYWINDTISEKEFATDLSKIYKNLQDETEKFLEMFTEFGYKLMIKKN